MKNISGRESAIREFLARPEIGKRRISRAAFTRYDTAFTHRSFARERDTDPLTITDNERLEFLGDRVLNLVIAELLYSWFDEPEGSLSARMEWTKNRNLSVVICTVHPAFPGLIRVGRKQVITQRIIAGSFEAFIGALYLDSGIEPVKRMIEAFFGENIRKYSTETNYKKILQEILQKKNLPLPVYELEYKEGEPHSPYFTYLVKSEGIPLGRGKGKNKQEATQHAARNALRKMPQ
ncbi:MAG: ribonuclease III family protein [Methanoregulaceae archaeon]|jgi:ribonuclease-3|nr:ribonuclease III family protein [Methanoregulaceae archaeon]